MFNDPNFNDAKVNNDEATASRPPVRSRLHHQCFAPSSCHLLQPVSYHACGWPGRRHTACGGPPEGPCAVPCIVQRGTSQRASTMKPSAVCMSIMSLKNIISTVCVFTCVRCQCGTSEGVDMDKMQQCADHRFMINWLDFRHSVLIINCLNVS